MQHTTDTTGRRHELLFWCFAVAVLFAFLGRNALWGSENRWAEITREMILTGDYLHPAVNWRIYFDKPQLSYWLIVPFMAVFGAEELAARIPSALAALVALYGIIELGKSLYDRRTGLLAGWLTLGCYGFLFWGRTAAADMANTAATVLAVSFFYKVEKRAGFVDYFTFYLIGFLGALTKGLPALVIPVAFLAPHLLADGNWKPHLKFRHLAALLLGAGIYLLPFWAAAEVPFAEPLRYPAGAQALSGLELVWRENIIRVFRAFDHKDPIYSYLYNLPRIMLPWTLLILPAVIGYLRKWKELPVQSRELLSGILLVFILFTASTSRRWYYVLPLAPFCALLGAAAILRGVDQNAPWTMIPLRILRFLLTVAASLAVAGVVVTPVIRTILKVDPPLTAMIAVPVMGALAIAMLFLEKHPKAPIGKWSGLPNRLAATVLAGDILTAAVFSVLQPSLTVFRTEKPFFLELSQQLKAFDSGSILFFGNGEADPDFLFYSQRKAPSAAATWGSGNRHADFRRFIAEHAGRRVAILCRNHPERDLTALAEAAADAGLRLDTAKPDFLEPRIANFGSPKKCWAAWIIDVPAAQTLKHAPQPTSTESKP